MKRPFNNAGFTQAQAEILSLPHHKRRLELEEMTENFETWMTSKFRFTAHQREELANIDTQYVDGVIFYVTERWSKGHPIHFYKDEPIRMIDIEPINYLAEFVIEENIGFRYAPAQALQRNTEM